MIDVIRRLAQVCIVACIVSATTQGAPNFSLMPGFKISYQASPSPLDILFGNDIYICDNDIVVLSNGNYIASHAYFGNGSTSDSAAITKVFRSTDKGTNWTQVAQFQPLWRGSLYVYGGAVYICGPEYEGGTYSTIRKSTDNGTTWTTPTDANSGKFQAVGFTGNLGTPNNPLVFNNRVYYGGGGRSTIFTTNMVDLLITSDWLQSNGIETFSTWQVGLSGTLETRYIGEGQVVASPEQGVAVLAKVVGYPYAAVVRGDAGVVRFGPDNDFAAMPGAEKKFGAMYDPVSGKFYVLSNPVLPAHANDPDLGSTPEMIRNTAAVLSSRDLSNWEVEKIFLYSPNIDYEAWQYLQFDFDGNDMVVASRTAFDVGDTYKPPRGHDSNLLTFHRIPNFRTHVRDHYLFADTANNQVLRYERTQHADAPLGKFTLGTSLTAPKDLAQDTNGDVYIRENGGRILRFDAMGNLIAIVGSSPVGFTTPQLSIVQPPAGERSWIKSGSGNWGDPLNWYYWGRPDTTAEITTFGSAATNATTVTVDADPLIWSFNTANDEEGWMTSSITGTTVSNGVFSGISSNAPYLSRVALSFPGSLSPEVRVRMKASGSSTNVAFYWGTTISNSFHASRKINAYYTGTGTFQNIVIPMAGNPNWNGQTITRIRFDLPKDIGATFEVDSIQVPRDSFRLKGIRFRSTPSYTISGTGSLRIEPDAGNGIMDVQSGSHLIGIPLTLATNTDCAIATGASLTCTGAISGVGALTKTGDGTLILSSTLNNPLNVIAGVFKGTVTVNHNVTINGGIHAPGNSTGIMQINSNYTLNAAGTLQVEINGTTAGTQHDQLKVAGNVTVAGALDIIAAPALAAGSTFTILDNTGAAAVSGAFTGLAQNAEFYEDSQWWRISYTGGTGNDVVLTRLTPTPWQNWQVTNFGSNVNNSAISGNSADPDTDGISNLLEYALGGNPLLGTQSPLPVKSVAGGRLTLTFTRTLANTDITMIVQGSGAMSGPWTDLASSTNGASFNATNGGSVTETGSGATRTVEVRDAYLISDPAHPSRFMRLRVTR
jgi:hypothetical protein